MATTTGARPLGLFEWNAELREAKGLSLALRGVLSILATYATTETGADIRPALSLIAERTGHGRSTLTKHVADALDRGWLTLTADNSKQGRPNVYQLSAPATGGDREPREGDREPREGDREPREGCIGDEQGVTGSFRTTSTDTSAWTSSNTSSNTSSRPAPSGPSVWDVIEADERRIEAEMAKAPAFD